MRHRFDKIPSSDITMTFNKNKSYVDDRDKSYINAIYIINGIILSGIKSMNVQRTNRKKPSHPLRINKVGERLIYGASKIVPHSAGL